MGRGVKQTTSARTCGAVLCLGVIAIVAIAACSLTAAAPAGGLITVPLPESDVAVYMDASGMAAFTGTDIQRIGRTGEPSLPCQSVTVLLPPGTDLRTVKATITGYKWTKIDGEWDVAPVGPYATGYGEGTSVVLPDDKNIIAGRDAGIYESDALFPVEPVCKVDTQVLRGWKMAQVFYAPYGYKPVERKVYQLSGKSIEITFETTSLKGNSAAADLTSVGQIWDMTVNSAEMAEEYGGYAVSSDTGRYVIITTSAIQAASADLMDFVASKEARGFTVQVVTEGTWGGGTGDAAAENLRSWLQANYLSSPSIEYVLLIGNPHPSTGDVPMKMCYPQYYDMDYPDCPTDFYYAELTADWDADNDGKYGEYDDDFLDFGQTPPRAAEVAVGRIPYYGSIADLDHILSKIIDYENAPASSISWRENVLLPMKPSDASTPGYQLGEEIKDDVLVPNAWTYHRVYEEDYGLSPAPETTPCNEDKVTYAWTGSEFGAVFWWTHGSSTSASYVMDLAHAATLDDEHPGFTFQASCLNGKPETTNNLGYSLLKNGCISTVSASRVSWYEQEQTSFAGTATNSGMAFEYSLRLIADEMYAGDALNDIRLDVSTNDEVLWMNYLDFNIYGCPAVGLFNNTAEQTSPSVVTYYAKSVTATSARLSGNLTSLGTADNVTVSFVWGTSSGSYSYPNETAGQVMTGTGAFFFDLGGLDPGETFYYRAKAAGNGTAYGLEKTFTTVTEPPSVDTNVVTDIGTTWAVLNGDLGDLGTSDNVSVSFEWGISDSYGDETTPVSRDTPGTFSENLTGLTAKTTYHFRAKAVGHGTAYGSDMAFTTLPVPPSVTTNDATNLGTTSARLYGNLSSLGTATSVSVSFEWGTAAGGPYPNSTAGQARTATGSFYTSLGGLTPGTTYYHRAKAVGDGTAYGDENSFTTLTTPPSVATGDPSNIAIDGARLNGSLSSLGTADSVSVSFEWGPTASFGYETTAEMKTTTGAFYFDLSGLAPYTPFYYRAKAVGHGEAVHGLTKYFTTGTPPVVATLDAGDLNFTSAKLNGDLTSLGAADNVTVSFVWGLTPECTNETAAEIRIAAGAFSFGLDSLNPGTTYYYRAKAYGSAGPVFGDQMAFATLSPLPAVTTGDASDVTATAARLSGDLSSLGSAAGVAVSFEWGTVSGIYTNGTTAEVKASAGTFYVDLAGLNAGTTYYYRAKAEGDGGVAYGDQRVFGTSILPPMVTTGDATGVTASSAVLNANLISLGTKSSVAVSFLWKSSGGTYTETTSQVKTAAGAVFVSLGGLSQGTTYYYMVKAVGHVDPVYGDEMSFTTADGAAPMILMNSASAISSSGATIAWTTSEPATSQVEYGLTQEYGSLTPLSGELVESHSIRLIQLKAGRVYHYRVVSTDAAGNQAVSADGTFTTESRSGAMPLWLWILMATCVGAGVVTLAVLLPAMHRKNQTGAAA